MSKIEKGDMVECIDDSNPAPEVCCIPLVKGQKYVANNTKICCQQNIDVGILSTDRGVGCACCGTRLGNTNEAWWFRASRFRKIEPDYKLVEIETSVREELKKLVVTEKIDA